MDGGKEKHFQNVLEALFQFAWISEDSTFNKTTDETATFDDIHS